MKQEFRLNLSQTQTLRLTQEMRQSIEMLQLNKAEMIDFINRQLEENPMLDAKTTDDFESIENIQTEYQKNLDYVSSMETYGASPYVKPSEEKEYDAFRYLSSDRTLYIELTEQLHSYRLSKKEYEIGEYIISNIDSRGYLEENLPVIANQCSVSIPFVEEVLQLIQTFEPSGICARNLKECLLIQVKDREPAHTMIEQYLDDIAANRVEMIAKALNLPVDTITEEMEYIRTLNPKPGASYNTEDELSYIIPDARIEKQYNGYQVVMLNQYVPEIYISKTYMEMLKNSKDKDMMKYMNKKVSSARWLIQSIAQRQSTIQRILEEIIKDQTEFFEKGIKYMKPVSQKELAHRMGVNESTISRATSNKYVETPQGTFELKYFFSGTIQTDLGEQMSDKAVRQVMLEIVNAENKKKPLSDQKIKSELEKRGIIISRRTVQKYRDELGILNSTMRKQH